ncbi:MAG: CDP-diacylglycerol--serine O-phosphatidyltransferase [Thiotrichales bacterium]
MQDSEPRKPADEASAAPEEVRRPRGIYLLPNLFTTAALFSGFYAIIAAQTGRFQAAAVAVFIAMILDAVDGRVARMTNTQSAFGAQYDSLADLVSFGLAPALVMYQWSLFNLNDVGWGWAKLGWLAAFFYTAAAAMRLARFNVMLGTADKRYFLGLPSPTAAALMIGLVWMGTDLDISGETLMVPAFIVTVAAGALMVSNVLFPSFKEVDYKRRVPFFGVLVMVLVVMLLAFDPPKTLFFGFLAYTLSGPVIFLLRLRKRKHRRDSPKP